MMVVAKIVAKKIIKTYREIRVPLSMLGHLFLHRFTNVIIEDV